MVFQNPVKILTHRKSLLFFFLSHFESIALWNAPNVQFDGLIEAESLNKIKTLLTLL